MKMHKMSGLALIAVFAFSAVLAASASAVVTLLAEWLVAGNPIAVGTTVPAEANGEVELEDTSNKGAALFKGIGAGTLGPNGEGLVTEFLTASKIRVSLAAPLLGTRPAGTTCEESTTDIEIAPEGLPWETLLVLTSTGTFEGYVYNASYTVACLVLGIHIEDSCTTTALNVGGSGGTGANVAGGVEASGESKPLANCSVGGTEKGRVTALPGNLLTTTAGTLSVSSEG